MGAPQRLAGFGSASGSGSADETGLNDRSWSLQGADLVPDQSTEVGSIIAALRGSSAGARARSRDSSTIWSASWSIRRTGSGGVRLSVDLGPAFEASVSPQHAHCPAQAGPLVLSRIRDHEDMVHPATPPCSSPLSPCSRATSSPTLAAPNRASASLPSTPSAGALADP